MRVTLVHPTDKELEEAISYYEEQLVGLGDSCIKRLQLLSSFSSKQHLVGEKSGKIRVG